MQLLDRASSGKEEKIALINLCINSLSGFQVCGMLTCDILNLNCFAVTLSSEGLEFIKPQ